MYENYINEAQGRIRLWEMPKAPLKIWHRDAVLCLISIFSVVACTSPDMNQSDFQLSDEFTIESVVSPELIAFPMFASFDDRGRLFVFEATEPNEMSTEEMLEEPSYQIRLLTDTNQDGAFDQSVVYADQIPFPMGGAFYKGSLYVAASPDVLKFTDLDEDGVSDKKEVLLTGWTLNHNGAILSGPFMGPDGWMYVAGARRGFDITTPEGKRLQGKGARIWRFRPDGSGLEWLSGGGFDNSIEIDFMPSGDPIGTMTYFRDPADGQRDALMHWVYGGVYPKPQASIREDQLKLTGDLMPVVTKMPRVAPSGIVQFRGDQWGKEYEGKWYSAIFNTGQILQHTIEAVGGSYESVDSQFLSSSLPDFHPTDVLQDGNGDLLIVVTGGWFINGCPLSKVAKPDVSGGIYRIRKNGSVRSEDPWGNQIKWREKNVQELATLLDDERLGIRMRAMKELEQRGKVAIPVMEDRFRNPDENIRLQALFVLYRIDPDAAQETLRTALSDKGTSIRTAAARLCGLSREEKCIPELTELVVNDPSTGVRRQAASALGQIGSERVIPALLEASVGIEDRFLLHAIRYALITINKPDKVLEALHHKDAALRMTAITVLDQMDHSPLSREHVRPFLESENKELQKAGVWVLQHHPEWSGLVTDFLKNILAQNNIDEVSYPTMQNLLITFCGERSVQKFIASHLTNKTLPDKTQVLLLKAMSQCPGQVPSNWKTALSQSLRSSSPQVLSTTLGVIGSRQITGLAEDLNRLLRRHQEEPVLYMQALQARTSMDPVLSHDEFKRLTSWISPGVDIPIQRSAVRTLEKARLNNDQIKYIAQHKISTASEMVLPGLMGLFTGDSIAETGQSLVSSLSENEGALTVLSESELHKIFDAYPNSVKEAAQPLLNKLHKQSMDRLNRLNGIQTNLVKGDVGRGRDLFFGKAICSTCHTVGSEGSDFGPDLTNIGEIRSRHDLLEAIVFPGASFAREYETYRIRTSDQTYTGILDPASPAGVITLKTAPGQVVRIPAEKMVTMEPEDISLMPGGLNAQLSNQELSDLIAFLEALPYRIDRLIELTE